MVICLSLLAALSAVDVSILEPSDGASYDGDWLTIRAVVENDNSLPDSVTLVLNGGDPAGVPRLVTDWYTYMGNHCRTGYSESPAPHDNTVMWTAAVTGTTHEFATPVIVDGRVYYNSSEDRIAYCLDAATGEELWRYEGMSLCLDDGMHVQDGRAYLSCDSVYCLDALTGERLWAFSPGVMTTEIPGPPVPYGDRVYFNYGSVFALDIATGQEVWRSDEYVGSVSTLTVWGGNVYCPWQDGLAAFDAETGEIVWNFGCGGFWDSSPCLVDGVIYIGGSFDDVVYAIDASDGSLIWQSPELGFITSTPAFHDGRVFVGVDELPPPNPVVALDSSTGAIEWQYLVPIWENWLHGSPGVADGLVFFGDATPTEEWTAYIRALDEETGEEIWSYGTTTSWMGVVGSPAITDGVMYIAASDSNLYAFGTGLKWTYRDDLYADLGTNELIVNSWSGGAIAASDTIQFVVTQTGIATNPGQDPAASDQALTIHPNPFASCASIAFELASPGVASVRVFDLSGRLVRTLRSGELPAGTQLLSWDGSDDSGRLLPPGIYALLLSSPEGDITRSVCLLR
ncbi:MAG: PQQ-binding-like beta-propeller repeat protein [Candidatus Fermentibacter sp.]|nr:PQQ-binding-like beta-propeller repeat protein [Candidatus Fermentibacter sp.]